MKTRGKMGNNVNCKAMRFVIRNLIDVDDVSPAKAPEPLLKVWKTRSVFWDLSYWKIYRVPHSLDVMHITKNMCESMLGTLLNMP